MISINVQEEHTKIYFQVKFLSIELTIVWWFLHCLYRATNVARNINDDSDLENPIASEFVIISSNEQSEGKNDQLAANARALNSTNAKKTSSSMIINLQKIVQTFLI